MLIYEYEPDLYDDEENYDPDDDCESEDDLEDDPEYHYQLGFNDGYRAKEEDDSDINYEIGREEGRLEGFEEGYETRDEEIQNDRGADMLLGALITVAIGVIIRLMKKFGSLAMPHIKAFLAKKGLTKEQVASKIRDILSRKGKNGTEDLDDAQRNELYEALDSLENNEQSPETQEGEDATRKDNSVEKDTENENDNE